MPFGLRTVVGSGNHVIDGVRSPIGTGNFEGGGASHCKVWGHSAVIYAKTAKSIEMLFGLGGPKESCIRWGADPPYEGAIIRGKNMPGHARR